MARISKESDIPQTPGSLPSNGKTIVLAEDDPFISRMYQAKLSMAGYTVLVEANGREAYEKIKEVVPDLMMLDLNMPELTGFDILKALQQDNYDFSKSAPIILTNSSDPENIDMAKQLGVEYLIKAELTPKSVLDYINNKLGVKAKD